MLRKKWLSTLTSVLLAMSLLPAPAALADKAQTDEPTSTPTLTPSQQQEQNQQPEQQQSQLSATLAADSSSDELIIKYKDGSDLTKVMGKHKGKIEKTGKQIGKLKAGIVKLHKGSDKKALIEELQADPDVEYVQENNVYQAAGSTMPNDSYYGEQWNLKHIKADNAWEITTGSPSTIVAVVDTGVKSTDADLKGNLLPGYNTIDGSNNTEDDSGNLHGTSVAGIIAATANNNYQISGVAPGSKVLPVKSLNARGFGYDLDLAEGIIWAADHGAKVINMSFTTEANSRLLGDAISYATMKGIVLFTPVSILAAHPDAIGVGAVDAQNTLVDSFNLWTDVVAPGANIRTTNGSLVKGTSFANAHVSGAAALLLSKQPTLTPAQVHKILRETAIDLGETGMDSKYGYGLLDVQAAVNVTASQTTDLMLFKDGPDPMIAGQTVNEIQYSKVQMQNETVKIYDSSMRLIKTLNQSEPLLMKNQYKFKWDGTDQMNVPVPKGTYHYALQGTSYSGVQSESLTGTITVTDDSLPGIDNVTVSPNPFKANGSNSTRLSYKLLKESKVTVSIYNGTTLVRKLTDSAVQNAGNQQVDWDGRDDRGQLVPDATYSYEIHAEDVAGKVAPVMTGSIALTRDPNYPVISNLSDIPERVTDKSQINFTLDTAATIGLEIFDGANKQVRTLINRQALTSGAQQVTWDGTSDAGVLLADQEYAYKVFAVDATGAIRNEVWGSITLDKSKPVITNVTLNTNTLITGDSKALVFDYDLSENVNSSIDILNTAGQVIATVTPTSLSPTKRTASWSGRNGSGVAVPSGDYTYRVTAIDAVGLQSVPTTGTLQVSTSLLSDVDIINGFNNRVRMYFTLSDKSKLNLGIYDSNGALVYSRYGNNEYAANSYMTEWDSKDSAGNPVKGTFTYKIEATALDGQTQVVTGTFDNGKLEGYQIVEYRYSLFDSKKGTPLKVFTVRFSEAGYVNVRIRALNKQLMTNRPVAAGEVVDIIWDGTDGNGNIAPPGDYLLAMNYTDRFNQSFGHSQLVYVDNFVRLVRNLTDGPDPFLPAETSKSTINFTLGSDSNIFTLEVFDNQGQLVRTLLKDQVKANPNYSPTDVSVEWDGKDNSGNLVPDGTYTYKVSAYNLQTTSGTITVDTTAPAISDHVAKPAPFNPTLSEVDIAYNLSEDAKVSLDIYDGTNTLIQRFSSDIVSKAGANHISWDGKTSTGILAPKGTYQYKVTPTDAVGLSTSVTGEIKLTDSTPPVISDVSATPGSLKVTETTSSAIAYKLSDQANVTLKVYDSNNRLVRTLLDNASTTAGTQTAEWNGKNDAGEFVEDDTYTYKFNATNAEGMPAKEVTGTITTDKNKPVISNLTATPSLFAPIGTNKLSIKYEVNESSAVTVNIYNSANELVKTVVNNVANTAGNHTVSWDGTDSTGAFVPVGVYNYQVLATDAVGFTDSLNGQFTVGSAPVISDVRDTNDPLKVTGTTASTISYTLSASADVTLNIYDSNGALVTTLFNNESQAAGAQSVVWYGKNDAGTLVEDGTYTYKINAVNALGLAAAEATGTITTDKNAPVISDLTATPNLFAPNGTNKLSIKYNLSEPSTVTVGVYNSANELVKTLTSGEALPAGTSTVTWDGKNSAGASVPVGDYRYQVLATDAVGFTNSLSDRFNIAVAPVISNVSDNPDPLKVTGTTASTIYYTLSEAANVTLKIYDSNGVLVNTLLDNVPHTAGTKPIGWYGKNDAGALVEDGTYTYKINAVNALGLAAAEATGTITTDKNAPIISKTGVSLYPFNQTLGGNLTIKYELNEDSRITVNILNASGITIRTLPTVTNSSGPNSIKWDGKDSTGTLVTDGMYTCRILATDMVGLSQFVKVAIKMDSTAPYVLPVISDVKDNTDPLKVTGTISSTIYYTLNKSMIVTVKVYDSTGRLVRTLIENVAQTAKTEPIAWNGTDEEGHLVEDGTYTYKITGLDVAADLVAEATGTITTDKNAPVITNLKATPSPFSPTRDGAVTISYELNEDAKVTLGIYNSAGTLVRALATAVPNTAGANQVIWDGKDNSGVVVPVGTYTYRILATDIVGFGQNKLNALKVE